MPPPVARQASILTVPIMSLLLKVDMSLPLRLAVVLTLSIAVGWLFQGADTAAHRFVRRRTTVADTGGAEPRIVLGRRHEERILPG